MSKIKKKKSNVHHLEKVAKAQHRNEYIRKIRKVLNAIDCAHVFALLPQGELNLLYNLRCQTINITIASGDIMPPGKLKWIKRLLSAMLKRYEIQLSPDGALVDLDTYFTAGITLLMYGNTITFEDYPNAAKVKEALMPYLLDREYKNQAYVHLRQISDTISLIMSDLTKRIYWATVDLNLNKPDSNLAYHMVWHSMVPKKIYVPIQGEHHTAYPLGIARYQTGPDWVYFKAGRNLAGVDNPNDVYVYIQSHVLKRLYERIDCIPKESVFLELLKSFEDLRARREDETGRIFIDLRLYDVKVGYLLANMIDNKLIIRTFLFITLTGSPEGNTLRKNARLKKDEITFLELDRLSTFMTPEIQHNKHIKQFFIEAGLKPLFDLYKILVDKNITITKHANTTLIEDYLGIDLTREFMDEDDEIGVNDDMDSDEDDETDGKDEIIGDEDDEMSDKQTKTSAKPQNSAEANAAIKTRPKLSIGKRIIVGGITFILRSFVLLQPFFNKHLDQEEGSNANDINEINNLSKDNKFSASRLSRFGKILGWLFLIFIGIPSYIVFVFVTFIVSFFRKGKKKKPMKIDYKQFHIGRRQKKPRK